MGRNCDFKEETHAARWGLLRGYSGTATKWVDFVVAASTRRESCHALKISDESNLRQAKTVEKERMPMFGFKSVGNCTAYAEAMGCEWTR